MLPTDAGMFKFEEKKCQVSEGAYYGKLRTADRISTADAEEVVFVCEGGQFHVTSN